MTDTTNRCYGILKLIAILLAILLAIPMAAAFLVGLLAP